MVENITFSLSKPITLQNSKHHVFEFSAKQWEWKDWWCFELFCRGGRRKTWCFLSSTTFSLAKEKIWCFWWNTYGFFFISKIDICDKWKQHHAKLKYGFFFLLIFYHLSVQNMWRFWCDRFGKRDVFIVILWEKCHLSSVKFWTKNQVRVVLKENSEF